MSNGLTLSNRNTADDWREFFNRFAHIILVANSAEAKPAVTGEPADDTLYVFFNDVFRVLDAPFGGKAILVCRSQHDGPIIVRDGNISQVLRHFSGTGFGGVLNVRGGVQEKFGVQADFGTAPTGFLDLAEYFDGFYPANRLPSTGFAILVWLVELKCTAEIILAGFSAKRAEARRLQPVHDWGLEQLTIAALTEAGKVKLFNRASIPQALAIARRFPDLRHEQIQHAATVMLTRRLDDTNELVDRLFSATKPLRALERLAMSAKTMLRRWRKPSQ